MNKLLVIVGIALIVCLGASAQTRVDRIQHKVELVKQGMQQQVTQGRKPGDVASIMDRAKQAFDSGDADKGESLVDQALQMLGRSAESKLVKSNGPVSNLYANPQPLEITGYSENEDEMEPCISLDGRYLFWNGSNADDVPTHIYWAKRISDLKFQCLGIVPGSQSAHRDMAPTLDAANNMFFGSDRSFAQDHRTVHVGHWEPKGLSHPVSVAGDISNNCGLSPDMKTFKINMDQGISPDGKTLILSHALFVRGEETPKESDLVLSARNSKGEFNKAPNSDEILRTVNTEALEYAPGLSSDGLELYFTRAATPQQLAKNDGTPFMQTMIATRKSTNEPFGTPARLTAIEGFCEAPSITLDRKQLFFHKKVGKYFRIFRVTRTSP
jgi:hypothetical protein